jgi:hypothetical protein
MNFHLACTEGGTVDRLLHFAQRFGHNSPSSGLHKSNSKRKPEFKLRDVDPLLPLWVFATTYSLSMYPGYCYDGSLVRRSWKKFTRERPSLRVPAMQVPPRHGRDQRPEVSGSGRNATGSQGALKYYHFHPRKEQCHIMKYSSKTLQFCQDHPTSEPPGV